MPPWNAAKAKEKKEAQAKASRRDIAGLLERGKVETARIKVESLIHEDIHVELLELLELYCEMLLARFGLLDQTSRDPDVGIKESVCNIIHAAPRTELKELHILRDILMHKYGRDFSLAVMENRDGCVSERITRKLDIATPSLELVDAYLHEIAKGYSVDWSPPTKRVEDHAPEVGTKVQDLHESTTGDQKETKEGDKEDISKSSAEDTSKSARDDPAKPPPYSSSKPSAAAGPSSPESESPKDELDALMKRFAALKKPIPFGIFIAYVVWNTIWQAPDTAKADVNLSVGERNYANTTDAKGPAASCSVG
ncbi:hypothetical protein H0H92_009845 [Tricholoma furcatifolium]|nr:hypothetical protein H0H92_009845 [Tricholoma furcatifolium]